MIVEMKLPEYFWLFALNYSLTMLIHCVEKKASFTLLAEAMGRSPSKCEPYITTYIVGDDAYAGFLLL